VKINVANSDQAQISARYQTCQAWRKEEEKTLIPRRVWYVEKLILTQLHIVKDVGMLNEASPESVRLVIRPCRPLSIRLVVHANRHLGSSKVAGYTPLLLLLLHILNGRMKFPLNPDRQ